MNKRLVMGREIKVNWATTSTGATNKIDTSSTQIFNEPTIQCSFIFLEHFHIFVGDLAPEIDQNALREAFSPFGEIS
jgi:nucleolysin TIA-1/TIAR